MQIDNEYTVTKNKEDMQEEEEEEQRSEDKKRWEGIEKLQKMMYVSLDVR